MAHYLLSVHTPSGPSPDDAPPTSPPSEEELARGMAAVEELEADLHAADAWVFSARLHGADTATVVRHEHGEALLTDGPYLESKEHVAGFYVISAPDLDAALSWGDRVAACVGMPIEVRPFAAWQD